MKRKFALLMSTLILLAVTPMWPADKDKDEDRLNKSGTVLKEILGMPDNIPENLLSKADCVVVFPSVLKAAFIVDFTRAVGGM